MQETTPRAIDWNGHAPEPISESLITDHDRWAAYWQEMRAESLTHVGVAFDMVAEAFDAGDSRAAVDVVLFCADESTGVHGICGAIVDLLLKTYTGPERVTR